MLSWPSSPSVPKAVLALMLGIALSGCSDSAAADEQARGRIVADFSQLPGVEAVGVARAGGSADLVVTVLPDVGPDRAEELLDEGARRLWKSDLELLTGIRVTVTPGERPDPGAPPTDLVYDEDVEQVQAQLLERFGPRGADAR